MVWLIAGRGLGNYCQESNEMGAFEGVITMIRWLEFLVYIQATQAQLLVRWVPLTA